MPRNIGKSYAVSIGRTYVRPRQTTRMRPAKTQRTFWQRVQEALRDAHGEGTQEEAAKIAGVKQPSISLWNQPTGGPKLRNALKLAVALGVCVEWLYTERGPKRPGPIDDAQARRLWDLWARLDDASKDELVGYAAVRATKAPPSSNPSITPRVTGRQTKSAA